MSEGWLERFKTVRRGPDKVLPLGEALERAVRPGMTLHFAFTHNRPTAVIAQLVRQFRGQDARFTALMLFTAGPAVALLTEGLVRRLVTAAILDPYPAPGPSEPARRALVEHGVELEHWSVLSYLARLEAAARSLPALPVRGLLGSTLAEENREHLRPGPDGTLEVLPLVPDLSFVHAPCADRSGNVLLAPPYGEGIYGGLAAREGVVATVERLVEPEVLSRHAHLLGIPAGQVQSVSVVPFGAHPSGLAAGGVEGVEPYGDDPAFYAAAREAGRTREGWSRWIEEFILGPRGHDDYLARVGPARLLTLAGKGQPDSWRPELLGALAGLSRPPPTATRPEAMMVACARLLVEKVRRSAHRAILAGIGAGNLGAWLAHAFLASDGAPPMLVAELGMAGYWPRPCDPNVFNLRNLATCTLISDAPTALGLLVGGAGARCLGSLAAAQVDARGRFNSTRLADGTLLVGSGGANDVASTADEVVLTLPADRRRLVEELPYVTGPGARVSAVVTDLGLLEKPPGDAPLCLTRLVEPLWGGNVEAHVRELAARCSFPLKVARELGRLPPPERPELELLRLFDPERAFLGPPEVDGSNDP